MIKSLTITNYLGDSIKLELMDPASSGFIVKSIDGLGPTKANINTSTRAMSDGSVYNSARLDSRSIVLSLGFLQSAKESIEDVRHKSYKYFPIKKKVSIVIETDRRLLEAEGYVEANEPDIFSNEEGCSITINCPDAYLYSKNLQKTTFSGIEPAFEFPFINESLDEPLLEFSLIKIKTEGTVYYKGDSEIGVEITIHAIGEASNVKIFNLATRDSMSIESSKLITLTGSDIKAGDTIIITTTKGNKSATLIRDGKRINILNCLNRDAEWFNLALGDNLFAYSAEKGSTNLQFAVVNRIAYEGA